MERFLNNILCVLSTRRKLKRHCQRRPQVAAYQEFNGPGIAVTRTPDEFLVRQPLRLTAHRAPEVSAPA